MEPIFIQLAIILFTAFILSYLIRVFKQPLIVGYIIAGIIISPFIIKFGASTELIQTFSKFGITFLLFMVGLHVNPKVIKEIGTSSLLIGLGQMILTFLLGFLISNFVFGWDTITSVYVGIALSFSSTIIVTKLLSDRGQIDSLHGKISVGILIIQDLVAIIALIVISSVSIGTGFGNAISRSLIGGGILVLLLFAAGFFILPKITKSLAKSHELLFLFSITWAFGIAALFSYVGFSIEIGALLAGISLSISPYSTEINAKIRPLRDFFLIIFFIILGLNIQFSNIGSILIYVIVLSLAVLIFKPLFLMALSAVAGYTKRTNFLVGTTLAQISEFSLIVLALGLKAGHITANIVSTLTFTGIITITLSTYLIMYSNEIYEKLSGVLSIFEKKKVKKDVKINKKYDAILFGYNRIGYNILRALKKVRQDYLVVDFNPEVISDLNKLHIPALYGDSGDSELLDDLPLDKIKIAISTIPDYETNMLLIEQIRLVNPNAIVIVRAHQISDAFDFYKEGATYVLTPHFLGGEYVAKMIRHYKTGKKNYNEERKKHIDMLKDILERGKEHPDTERG